MTRELHFYNAEKYTGEEALTQCLKDHGEPTEAFFDRLQYADETGFVLVQDAGVWVFIKEVSESLAA